MNEKPAKTTGKHSRGLVTLESSTEALHVVVAEGDDWAGPPFEVQLVRNGPGDVIFTLKIEGTRRLAIPLDNFVKAAIRLDADYATGAEREIQQLQRDLAKADALVVDQQMKIEQLEAKLLVK